MMFWKRRSACLWAWRRRARGYWLPLASPLLSYISRRFIPHFMDEATRLTLNEGRQSERAACE